MDVLDEEFLSEDEREIVREEVADSLGTMRSDELDRECLTDAVREEVADALRMLRAEQLGLVTQLADQVIKWTIGTGLAVVAVVIIALKWL